MDRLYVRGVLLKSAPRSLAEDESCEMCYFPCLTLKVKRMPNSDVMAQANRLSESKHNAEAQAPRAEAAQEGLGR